VTTEHRTIRTAICNRLKSVAGIGQVFDYERYAKTESAFKAMYAAGERLLGWHVRRVARKEDDHFNKVATTWEIRGFMAIDDQAGSELEFDDLIDGISDAWRLDPTLGELVAYPHDYPVTPELVDSSPVMFSGVLCHSAKLRLVTKHYIDNVQKPWD